METPRSKFRPASTEFTRIEFLRQKTDASQQVEIKKSQVPNLKKILIPTAVIVACILVIATITCVVLLTGKAEENESDKDRRSSTVPVLETTTDQPPATTSSTSRYLSTTVTVLPEIDGWRGWGFWTTCTSSCGPGLTNRYRVCGNDAGNNCTGIYVEQVACSLQACTEYGTWTTWNQWQTCDVTCGGGKQTRIRSCVKTATEHDCVGDSSQIQDCNQWSCPDCGQMCTEGILNVECDTCICEGEHISGKVFNKFGAPLSSVSIANSNTPARELTMTDIGGHFSLNTTCLGSSLLLTKVGFQDTRVYDVVPIVNVTMLLIQSPSFLIEPQSKSRLVGESAYFCCAAKGNPDIKYYEWFKDGLLLNNGLYPNGTHLQLLNIAVSDSGSYKCRANSDAGAAVTREAVLVVKGSGSEFCVNALKQKTIVLPSDCAQEGNNITTYEVGMCETKACREERKGAVGTCSESTKSCCSVAEFNIDTIQCSDYELKLVVVKSCECSTCETYATISIYGEALGVVDGSPLAYGEVWANGEYTSSTNQNGYFSIDVNAENPHIALTFVDVFEHKFLPTTKVITISEANSNSVFLNIVMIEMTNPVSIDPTSENVLSLISDPSNSTSTRAEVFVPPNTLYYANGTLVQGSVLASLTYLDPSTVTAQDAIPGMFRFVNEEGEEEALETMGVFSLSFTDPSGETIHALGDVDLYLDTNLWSNSSEADGIKLWGLNTDTGNWEELGSPPDTNKRRKKRQSGYWMGSIDFSNYRWSNIDKTLRGYNWYPCYFKIKIYKDSSFDEELLKNDYTLKLQNMIYNNGRIVSIRPDLSNDCFNSYCYDNDISALIELSFFDADKESYQTLIPADPFLHKLDSAIETSYNMLNYNVGDSGRTILLFQKVSATGPFFRTKEQCTESLISDSNFKFYFPPSSLSDIFTYLRVFKLVNYPPTAADLFSSYMAWYQKKDFLSNPYTACFVKIKFEGIESLSTDDGLKVRVFSYGGSFDDVKDEVFGIREEGVNGTVCVEYKCSSRIGFEQDQEDETKVKLIPVVPNYWKCTVADINEELIKSHSYNANTIGNETFEFYVDKQPHSREGLYHKSSSSPAGARKIAKPFCRSGIVDNYKDHNPDEGVAVTFSCSSQLDDCLRWWYIFGFCYRG